MLRKHEILQSRALSRGVHLWRYGHFGMPLIVFPSASGMAHEWQAHGIVDSLADLLEGGRLKLYCTESNVAEAWTRKEGDPAWRIQRHHAFERYVLDELVPFVQEDCGTASIPLAVTGSSLGAFFAANFALKYPATFRWALCLSGRYNVTWLTDGFVNEDIYFNNPMAYVPGLNGEHLESIRRNTRITLVCGRGKWEDGNIEETCMFADMLAAKQIPHECDLWGRDVSHEWHWWRRQLRYHLERALARVG